MAEQEKISLAYIWGGAVMFFGGIALAVFGPTVSGVTFKPVAGISVFAGLYLLAQAVERLTEWTIDLLSLLDDSPERRKQDSLIKVRSANSTLNGNPSLVDFGALAADGEQLGAALSTAVNTVNEAVTAKADGEKEVTAARRDLAFFAHGLSMLLAATAVWRLDYSVLTQIGVSGVDRWLDRLVTTLAAAGGTKALHELIGRLQKAKESDEKGEAAGK